MLRRSWTVCAMTALLLSGTAAAQSPGTLLVGAFWAVEHVSIATGTWIPDLAIRSATADALVLLSHPTGTLEADGVYTPASSGGRNALPRFSEQCRCW